MRFFTSYMGAHGAAKKSGIRSGDGVHTRGWNAGVRVTPRERGRDEFDVYMTDGSNGGLNTCTHIGTVTDTPNGPHWKPASKPGIIPASIDGKPVITVIPAHSHENNPAPDDYFCVVHTGSWPSGEPRFGIARIHRDENGAWSVTEHSDYWDHPMSQTEATTEVVRLAGHERPPTRT